ncbi:hypothetical protein PFISCL1PPCAC_12209, partial [Pristionchus fissidentatus]
VLDETIAQTPSYSTPGMSDEVNRDLPVESNDMRKEAEKEEGDAENREETSPELIADLAELLEPTTRLDVRRQALQIVLGLSFPLDGSAERVFCRKEFLLGKAICRLLTATASDRLGCLTGICNFASMSKEVVNYVLHNQPEVIKIAYNEAFAGTECSEYAARLIANCTRIFPGETHLRLLAVDPKCVEKLIDRMTITSGHGPSNTLGYSLVNLATVSRVRKELTKRREEEGGKSMLHKLYPALLQSEDGEKRRIAADVCRNCTFDDALHADLLDDSDDFLVALLSVIADANDTLDQEETDKLPARLQYFEGHRSNDDVLRKKVVDSLYQCCATRHGRERLRDRGVYVLAREFDRAMAAEREGGGCGPSAPKALKDFTSERSDPEAVEANLHNLIGVLIRYESEMCVDPELASIRELE